MTKEKILKQIEEWQEKGRELKEKIKELEWDVFNPYPIKEEDDILYKINYNGLIEKFCNCNVDSDYIYNGFNSKEYAELRQIEIDLEDRMWAFSYENGWEDKYMFDENEERYSIRYDSSYEECFTTRYQLVIDNNVYFVSEKVAEKAIEKFGDEMKELYKMRANILKEDD